ncbi:hypothetical protein F4X33_15315 [Candidatus Poribacteria bacterium]|nr:hypothetical protein [Candidatus Poribacteria bacterium]
MKSKNTQRITDVIHQFKLSSVTIEQDEVCAFALLRLKVAKTSDNCKEGTQLEGNYESQKIHHS